MARYSAWHEMSDQEKFEFLRERCMILSNAVGSLGDQVQGLHERLCKLEGMMIEGSDN
jgi:hypothetical protein